VDGYRAVNLTSPRGFCLATAVGFSAVHLYLSYLQSDPETHFTWISFDRVLPMSEKVVLSKSTNARSGNFVDGEMDIDVHNLSLVILEMQKQ
jgi:hypothetical protein